MYRALTLAIAVAVSLTLAGMAQAGGFTFKVNKQSTCQSGKINKINQHHNLYAGQIVSTFPKQQTHIAPVQKHCFVYKVLYMKPCWKHAKFIKVDTYAKAQELAYQLDELDYLVAIKKVAVAHPLGRLPY